MITENLKQVRKNIEMACARAGRDPEEVTLIAVSKTKPVSDLQEAYEADVRDFGENKVQELVDKYEELPDVSDLYTLLESSLYETPPPTLKEGYLIKEGLRLLNLNHAI